MKHIALSPHFDDAVLSCGGTIARLVEAGEAVAVVTLFGGEPGPPYSPFAEKLHALWGSPPNVVRLRRAEDRAAVARLGAEPHHLDVFDAIYRRGQDGDWLYTDDEHYLGTARHAEDAWLPRMLADQVRAIAWPQSGPIYAPLGIGGHVDHRLGFDVGLLLTREGLDVTYYEDFPYTEFAGASDDRLHELPGWQPQVRAFDARYVEAKIDAFCYYRSQLSGVFPGEPDVAQPFYRRHAEIGGERFWRPPS